MMSTILSLPEELIIEIMARGDHKMLLTCQRVSHPCLFFPQRFPYLTQKSP